MGIFANMFGGAQMAKASKKAAAAQTAAMQQGIGQQNQTLDTIGGYYQPYQEFGNTALGQYGDLLGIHGGDPQQAAITALQNSPYFKMLYGQGQEAVLQNASATGGIRGGNTEHSLYDVGQNTLAKVIQQQMQNLAGGASMGYDTAGALGNAALGTGNNITDLLVGQGQAKAQDILTRGALKNQMWSSLGQLGITGLSALAGMPGGMGGLSSLFGGGAGMAAGNSALDSMGAFNFGDDFLGAAGGGGGGSFFGVGG